MNRLQRALDIVFPEVNTLSWTRYSQSYMQFLSEYPSAASIASEDIRNLRKALEVNGRGRRSKVTAEEIKEAARNSVGDDNTAVALEVQSMIALINTRAEQIDTLDKKIEEFSHQLNSPITSIPGIGKVYSAGIIAEIGNVNRFQSQASVAKYAGLVWTQHQSGNFEAQHTRLIKSGNRYLRYYLLEAANSVRRCDSEFRRYYDLKYKEVNQFQHKRALALTARKLVRLAFRLLKDNRLYKRPEA